MSVSEIAASLALPKNEINDAVKRLIREKRARRVKGKLFTAAGQKGSNAGYAEVTGRLSVSYDGYGFVEMEKGDDIFIPRARLNGALNGDLVTAALKERFGRTEGYVVSILERARTDIAGRVYRKGLVAPLSKTYFPQIIIDEDYPKDDVLLLRITSLPAATGYLRGKVLERLGSISDKGIENLIVMKNYGLNRSFPYEVEQNAAMAAQTPVTASGREDFRKLFTVTIDGDDAKDFDDAVSVERSGEGYVLYVHIADVSAYVKSGSPLDREAFRRGTSVYFPEFAVPMLPEILSNGVCSLLPHVDRYSVTARIDYDETGRKKESKFFLSIINSRHRLTYAGVNRLLTDGACKDGELNDFIFKAAELSRLIGKRRAKDGMLSFDLPEIRFNLTPGGDISSVEPDERGESERLIECFMLEANEAAAEEILKRAPAGIFRNHPPPDEKKVAQWAKNAFYLGFDAGKIPKKPDNGTFQKWFSKIEKHRFSYILKTSLVRAMQKAVYESANLGHFGLASPAYTHFTSPIRRYPDLFVHRLLKKYLLGRDEPVDTGNAESIAKHSSVTERAADDAEREVGLYKKLAFLAANPEKEYSAFVSREGFPETVFIPELLLHGTLEILRGRRAKAMSIGYEIRIIWVRNDMDSLEAFFCKVRNK
jgi:ribonuclease R